MDCSKFLAKVIGIYLILVSFAMLSHVHLFITNVNYLIHDVPLMFVMGFITMILGILIVVSHNVWQFNWRLIITLIGWLTLFKGLSLLLYPHLIDQVTRLFLQDVNVAYVIAFIDLLIGVLLSYVGCKSE